MKQTSGNILFKWMELICLSNQQILVMVLTHKQLLHIVPDGLWNIYTALYKLLYDMMFALLRLDIVSSLYVCHDKHTFRICLFFACGESSC